MGYGLLARVLTGWTGDIEYYDDFVTVNVGARSRESAASLLVRLVSAVYTETGHALVISSDDSGTVTITHPAGTVFGIAPVGNTATRTGFSGTYGGAAAYTADDPMASVWVPERGARMTSPLLATSGRGQAVGDGSAASPPMRAPAGSRYVAWDDEAALALGYEYDYWHDGRLFGRFVIDGARHVPLGITRVTNAITLELDVREVA